MDLKMSPLLPNRLAILVYLHILTITLADFKPFFIGFQLLKLVLLPSLFKIKRTVLLGEAMMEKTLKKNRIVIIAMIIKY